MRVGARGADRGCWCSPIANCAAQVEVLGRVRLGRRDRGGSGQGGGSGRGLGYGRGLGMKFRPWALIGCVTDLGWGGLEDKDRFGRKPWGTGLRPEKSCSENNARKCLREGDTKQCEKGVVD